MYYKDKPIDKTIFRFTLTQKARHPAKRASLLDPICTLAGVIQNRMKFAHRFSALACLVLLNAAMWLLLPFINHYFDSHYPHVVPVGGLKGDPWKTRSLQGLENNVRHTLGQIYNDNRMMYAEGNDNAPLNLSPNTNPFSLRELLGHRQHLENSMVKAILSKIVGGGDEETVGQRLGNLQRLSIAAEVIKDQVNVSSLHFKGVLQLEKAVLNNAQRIQDYGKSFELNWSEKEALTRLTPRETSDAGENRINKAAGLDFVWTVTDDITDLMNITGWFKFYTQVTKYQMYSEDDTTINKVIRELNTLPITQLYLPQTLRLRPELELEGGVSAHFSPVLTTRVQETLPNQLSYDEIYRHTSEIAAFHLDRILGFRRASPVVGRIFMNITEDLIPYGTKGFRRYNTFTSLVGNKCFHSTGCKGCHGTELSTACGKPVTMEGSMLLDTSVLNVVSHPYPWARPQSLQEGQAPWQRDPEFCSTLRVTGLYYDGRRLLDLIDLAIFDFLIDNKDRTEYETFVKYEHESFILHNHNARGFGQAYRDDMAILAPLHQCCLVRYSTLNALLQFTVGATRLSDTMADSLAYDPVAPVLLKQHLLALDRRVSIVLKLVNECIDKTVATNIVIDDGL